MLWLAGIVLIALALLLTDRLLWTPGVTEDNVRRIRPGMTLAEVEALLACPACGFNFWAGGTPSRPRASQPVSIAPPILPAPASAMVPVMCCSVLTTNSSVVPAKRSAGRDP